MQTDRAKYLIGAPLDERRAEEGAQTWMPAVVAGGFLAVVGVLLVIMGAVGFEMGAIAMFWVIIIVSSLTGAAAEFWGMSICMKYDSDKFIWYFLFPIYRVVYMFSNFGIMKGPFFLGLAGMVGIPFILIGMFLLGMMAEG